MRQRRGVLGAARVMVTLALLIGVGFVRAQTGHAQQAMKGGGDQTLRTQLTELRAKVARLEATISANQQGKVPPSTAMQQARMQMGAGNSQPGLGMMEDEPMGMQDQRGGMSSMATRSGAGATPGSGMMGGGTMEMKSGMGGMEMMGKVRGSCCMPAPSALPGFPGASHLYHVGATGFFLDHPEHITLTIEQQTTLNRVKEKALLEQATTQRKIESAEQELWILTGADQPAADTVEAKIRDIEKLHADQRLAFIRAVGEAAQALTDEQRQALLGQIPPTTPSMPQGTPNMGAGMQDDM